MEEYRYIATSVEGFVQQVVCSYVCRGSWFFVQGRVPEGKDPRAVDRKLLERYGIAVGRKKRYVRKRQGLANLHYIRYEDRWLMLATKGRHTWFDEERINIRDVRKVPIQFHGYSIYLKPGHYRPHRCKQDRDGPAEPDHKLRVRVVIGRKAYRRLAAEFLEIAPRWPHDVLAAKFYCLPFEPYAPVRQQLLGLLRQVNNVRKMAGRERLSPSVLRYRRQIVKAFEMPEDCEVIGAVRYSDE